MILAIWIIISILEPLRHLYYIKTRAKSPRKWLSLSLRCLIGGLLFYWELRTGYRPWYIIGPAFFFVAWALHDNIMAVGLAIIFKRKIKPWYVNKKGVIDKPQNTYAPYIWFFKTFIGIVLPLMYYINYY